MKWLQNGALVLIALNLTFLSIWTVVSPAQAQVDYSGAHPGRGPQYVCRIWQGRDVCGLQVMVMNN